MDEVHARRLLLLGAVLLLPLPYAVLAEGAVPVVRFALLAGVAAAYSTFVNGGGVAWPLTGLLAAHALGYGLLLWIGSRLAVRFVPSRLCTAVCVGVVAAGFAASLAFDLYHTPFASERAFTSWTGLFR